MLCGCLGTREKAVKKIGQSDLCEFHIYSLGLKLFLD